MVPIRAMASGGRAFINSAKLVNFFGSTINVLRMEESRASAAGTVAQVDSWVGDCSGCACAVQIDTAIAAATNAERIIFKSSQLSKTRPHNVLPARIAPYR